jgi:hypothetical protein
MSKKPVLHRKDPPKEPPETEEPTGEESEEYRRFTEFGRVVFTVPKSEIDAEEKKEKRRKARKKAK